MRMSQSKKLFLTKVNKTERCWFWEGALTRKGYGRIRIDFKGHCTNAQRVAWNLWKGIIPKGIRVLHTCDVRNCVRPSHLWLGTQLENIADRVRKGRNGRMPGVRNPQAKLTNREVIEIRRRYVKSKNQFIPGTNIINKSSSTKLARIYNVSPCLVKRIANNNAWRHVQ